MLTMPEEVLLVHMRPFGKRLALERKNFVLFLPADETLAAARLIELVLAKRVALASPHRHTQGNESILIVDAAPTGDPLLDEALTRLGEDDRRRPSCRRCIKRLSKGSQQAYWDRLVAASLLRPGALASDSQKYVGDENAAAAIFERIRAVLDTPPPVDLRDAALVTFLAHARRTLSR
jgi:hypothetical protein